jgi:multimeric flavodoxin WrbA
VPPPVDRGAVRGSDRARTDLDAPATTTAAELEEDLMKSVVAFVGSARRNGLTARATGRFLDHLQSLGDVRTELVFLSDRRIGVCHGCKVCFVRGEECCPLKDDRDLLIDKMMAADGVVFASPNYSFQVSGLMKIFLDRLGFVFHRPCFHGKAFTCIVAQGIYGGHKLVKYLEFVGLGLGFDVVRGSCVTAVEPFAPQDLQRMHEVIARQSERFHEQLSKAPDAAPSMLHLWGFRYARTRMRLELTDDNRDHAYYRDRGWFDSDYYLPAKLGPLKKAAGASFDWLTARMTKQRECR